MPRRQNFDWVLVGWAWTLMAGCVGTVIPAAAVLLTPNGDSIELYGFTLGATLDGVGLVAGYLVWFTLLCVAVAARFAWRWRWSALRRCSRARGHGDDAFASLVVTGTGTSGLAVPPTEAERYGRAAAGDDADDDGDDDDDGRGWAPLSRNAAESALGQVFGDGDSHE